MAMPATGAFSGTPALSSDMRRGADRAHRGGAVGAQRLGDLADRVRELLAGRQHRHQRALGERAVADLAALRRADAAGLTGGVRREVVVVHVALAGLRAERVDLLLHPEHVQRGDAQDLGLAALEQRRAVHPRDHLDLGGQRADVRQRRGRRCGPCRLRIRWRTSFLVSERNASPISFSRPSNCSAELLVTGGLDLVGASSRSCLPAMVSACGQLVAAAARDGREHVVLVGREDREVAVALRRRGQLALRLAQDA